MAVYIACHGAILEPDDFVLLPSDINPKDLFRRAVTPQVLVDLMLRDTKVRRLLLMLDTCYSGQGGQEAAKAAVKWVNQPGVVDRPGVVLVTATHPWQEAQPGVFSKAFERAVRHLATGGLAQEDLPLDAVVNVIKADHEKPATQTVTWHAIGLDGLPPAFLPNKRYRRVIDADLLEEERAGYLEQEQEHARYTEQREAHVQQRFLPATRWFTGRHAALAELAAWLNKPSAAPSAVVVTGNAGSGKTALLGLLAVLSDPDRAPGVSRDGLPESFAISGGAIAEAIYAGTMTTGQVRGRIADAAGLRVKTTRELIDGLNKRDRPLVVLVDALDEAADPAGLITGLLNPLMTECAGTLRLLFGTRPYLLTALLLGTRESGRYLLVDLDSPRYADPASVRAYVRRILLADDPLDSAYRPSGVYRTAPPGVVDGVSDAIGQAAGTSFLVARITATTESTASELPDPDDPAWRASLPQRAGPAMRRDLRLRLGGEADKAEALLLPLAYAQGSGLPWEGIWPRLVEALSPGSGYDNNDLTWLRKTAGSYAVEGLAHHRSAYRLYHQALIDHLLEGRDQRADQRAIVEALIATVPARENGGQEVGILPGSNPAPDWSRAHPYVCAHLATHAQRAGALDSLLLDPGFLINAESAGLLAALPAAQRPDAQLAGRAYQRAVYQLEGQPEDVRYSYLELASRISDAVELADRIAVSAPNRRWSVPWTHWPPEYPHSVLAGRLAQVNAILCIDLDDGNSLVATIGQDASLRLWDVVTGRSLGAHPLGEAPLVAAQAVRLREHQTAIVVLAADGVLYLWDIATAAVLRRIPTTRSWRQLALARNHKLTLLCIAAPDGRQFAVVGRRIGRVSLWDLSAGQGIALPWGVAPEYIKFATLTNGKLVVIAAAEGAKRYMYDLQTGQALPYEQRRIPFPWLRAINDVIRLRRITYYAFRDGTPAIAVRAKFLPIVWDLTNSGLLDVWRGHPPDAQITQVRLQSGRIITIQLTGGPVIESPVSKKSNEGSETVFPLHMMVKTPRRPDPEAPKPLSLELKARGRFVDVKLDERPPDGSMISLTLAGHTGDVTRCTWTRLPDGHVIVITASRDGTVRTWDVTAKRPESGERVEQARVEFQRIVSARLPDGTPLGLSLARRDGVALWDLRNGNFIRNLGLPSARPWAIGIANSSIDSSIAVTFDSDGMMRRWNLPDCRVADQFPVDRLRWPSDVAFTRLTDGTSVAVTSGHGRRIAVWGVATGQVRNVLTGHRGWTSCVACAVGPGRRPIALTGGYDNRVNVWELRRGRRRRHFRIVPPWTFLARPAAGRAYAMSTIPLDGDRVVALVATSDGKLRALEPRRFPWGVRRVRVMRADAGAAAVLSDGRAIVATAGEDGVVRIWKPAAFTGESGDSGLLCEISIEVPVGDISFADHDMLVLATPNGLTAIKLDAAMLEKEGISVTNQVEVRYGAGYIRRWLRSDTRPGQVPPAA